MADAVAGSDAAVTPGLWGPAATPLGADGAPRGVVEPRLAALADLPRGERAAAASALLDAAGPTPWRGERRVIDGVACVATTFVAEEPQAAQVLLHVNSLTDRIREAVAPALLARVDGTDVWHLTWWLPEDLVASYRIAAGEPFALDVGGTRDGWLSVHERGRPDPRNPRVLVNPLGHDSSVLVGPAARVHGAWDRAEPPLARARVDELTIEDPVLGGPRRVWLRVPAEATRLLVLFDGATWHRHLALADALDAAGDRRTAVAMVDSRTLRERSEVLPHPDRVSALLEDGVLPAVHTALRAGGIGAPGPERTIVAGESFGGLAALGVVVTRPDLARRAIAQSPSLHFKAGRERRRDDIEPGDVVRLAEVGVDPTVEAVLTWGTEEEHLALAVPAMRAAFAASGAVLHPRAYAGGHDYAWWRTGLLDALSTLPA